MKQKITAAQKRIYGKIIEEATVECYDEYEEICGWKYLLDEKIAVPDQCKVGNQDALLEKIDMDEGSRVLIGVIRLNKAKMRILLQDIAIGDSEAMKYINAYKHWCKNG